MAPYDSIANTYSETIDLINDLDVWIFKNNLSHSRQRILDIGCGTGSILNKLKSFFTEIYGIDISTGMLELARSKIPHGQFTVSSGDSLSYSDNYFDMVISHAAFHNFDRIKGLEEAKRVLKKSGKLVIAEVVDLSPFEKKFERLIHRNIITMLRMFFLYGYQRTMKSWSFVYNDKWQSLTNSEHHGILNSNQFRKFYSSKLPNVKFGIANYRIHYLVWEKR